MYVNPYEAVSSNKGSWLKANFHVHSSAEGNGRPLEPDEDVRLYKQAGYDVLTLSNHSNLTDTGALGEKYDILTINGIEYIEYDGILCVGIKSFIKGEPQAVIDECARQGGFSVLCHPNLQFENGMLPTIPRELSARLTGYTGIEILTPVVFKRFRGSGLAVDLWDEYLTAGKLVWAFANDDSHIYSDIDRAWNMIYSESRTYESIKVAVKRGSLYASTGLLLHHFSFVNGMLSLTAGYKHNQPENIRYSFHGANGRLLHETTGKTGVFRPGSSEPYIRVQAVSEQGASLWTQPVYEAASFKYV